LGFQRSSELKLKVFGSVERGEGAEYGVASPARGGFSNRAKVFNGTMASAFAKCTLAHGVVLALAGCLQGFTIMPAFGTNAKLALTAHYKTFLHALLLGGVGAAASKGEVFRVQPGMIAAWLIVGGCWLSFYADVRASFINVHLPMAAANSGAKMDDTHLNSQLIVLSAVSVTAGLAIAVSKLDLGALTGAAAAASKSK